MLIIINLLGYLFISYLIKIWPYFQFNVRKYLLNLHVILICLTNHKIASKVNSEDYTAEFSDDVCISLENLYEQKINNKKIKQK